MNDVSWIENNGSWEAHCDGEYVGLVSNHPPGTMNAGMWSASVHTTDGGLVGLGPYATVWLAQVALENALGHTFAELTDPR